MKRVLKLYLERPELAALVMLVLLVILFQLRSNGIFLSGQNLRGVLGFLPEVALVAVGVGLLMICGEFDLSVGSTYAIMPMTLCLLANDGWGFVPAMIAGLLVCVVIGLVNGLITIRFAIPSFITTLGMLYIVRSLTVVMSGGFPPRFPTEAPAWLFVGFVGPFRASLFWFLALAVLATLLLERTNFGNWIRATGGQLEAAASMGIKTGAVKVTCFVICALFAGFAGTIQVMRLGSPLPSAGDGLELQAVAAAVIGGTALTGGIGTVLGAVVGAMLIRAIDNGLVLSQVDSNWFKFAIGALTIVAVISNVWLRRVGRRLKVEA
jgi:simple sugar transport system permease protein